MCLLQLMSQRQHIIKLTGFTTFTLGLYMLHLTAPHRGVLLPEVSELHLLVPFNPHCALLGLTHQQG